MKTKYANLFILSGLMLAFSAATVLINPVGGVLNGPALVAIIILVIPAVLLVGYGFKLRRLARREVEKAF